MRTCECGPGLDLWSLRVQLKHIKDEAPKERSQKGEHERPTRPMFSPSVPLNRKSSTGNSDTDQVPVWFAGGSC